MGFDRAGCSVSVVCAAKQQAVMRRSALILLAMCLWNLALVQMMSSTCDINNYAVIRYM